jgi:hypothetical protein
MANVGYAHTYNTIFTYEDSEQEFFDLTCEIPTDEEAFVHELIADCGSAKHAASLIKISMSLISVSCLVNSQKKVRRPTEEDLPVWLRERNGKYYFTDQDDDTRRWKTFRDSIVNTMKAKEQDEILLDEVLNDMSQDKP